jgi:short-subunit dehydrogenase
MQLNAIPEHKTGAPKSKYAKTTAQSIKQSMLSSQEVLDKSMSSLHRRKNRTYLPMASKKVVSIKALRGL